MAAAGRLVGAPLGYLLTNVFPALGLLLSLGLVAAAGALFLFYGLIAAVITARLEGTARRASVWAAAVLLVTLIGLSRVYLGVHYPSDVAAGYVAAFVWVMIVASADLLMEARSRQTTESR